MLSKKEYSTIYRILNIIPVATDQVFNKSNIVNQVKNGEDDDYPEYLFIGLDIPGQ